MIAPPSPFRVVTALVRGYAPRVLQVRGWVCAALFVLPVVISYGIMALLRFKAPHFQGSHDEQMVLKLFHQILAQLAMPILVLVAAPAGIREDLEQRTLPLVLSRPVPVWMLPFSKGLLWFGWGAVWIIVAVTALLGLGLDTADLPLMILGLLLIYWAELGFMTFMGLIFKRGTLWGALVLLLWDPLVRIFPGRLQRFTFIHYLENIVGSRGSSGGVSQLLAQTQISTLWPIAALVLLLFGLLCWAAAGWKLHHTPIGLAGADAEG
ncbi:MAG: hypothetical protein LWX11_01725 [Firmicutes bacterium]|nr:hypothetical protein [Bacillota bacterium]